MQKYILYIASSLNEVYECAYSILKYLEVYNLKPPAEHSLIIYTNNPDLLEAYGSFFNRFELRTMPANATKESILLQFQKEAGDNVLFFNCNTYPVNKIDLNNSIECYKNLKEFSVLLKDFFGKYQEESVPNQMKLLHNIDAKKIEDQKKAFEKLPFSLKWLKKLTGKGWNISDYLVRI